MYKFLDFPIEFLLFDFDLVTCEFETLLEIVVRHTFGLKIQTFVYACKCIALLYCSTILAIISQLMETRAH